MTEAKAVLASFSSIPPSQNKTLPSAYAIPDPPPWTEIAAALAAAEDALARLDERLAHSPIRDGWIACTHLA